MVTAAGNGLGTATVRTATVDYLFTDSFNIVTYEGNAKKNVPFYFVVIGDNAATSNSD